MNGTESMQTREHSRDEIDHLLSMAQDITANLGFHADAEERIADHLKRFWAPRMRSLLMAHAAAHQAALPDLLVAALTRLED